MREFEAFIFRHGVIADDERVQESAFREVLATFSTPLDHDDYRGLYAGRTDQAGFLAHSASQPHLNDHIDELIEMKTRAFRHFAQDMLVAYEGVAGLVDSIHSRGGRTALVSGSNDIELNMIMDALDLTDAFDIRVAADDLPSDESTNPYLLVAEQLGVEPSRCISFEHSPTSVAQAVAAGCHCIAVTVTHDAHELNEADEVVPTIFEWVMRNNALGAG